MTRSGFSRRRMLTSMLAGAAIVGGAGPASIWSAGAQDIGDAQQWRRHVETITGDAPITEDKVLLELPEVAENGNTVPYSVLVESPMTEQDHVRALYIIASANPQPEVATFFFTPQNGKAQIFSRMRLRDSQDVIAVAQMSDGRFFMGRRSIQVAISCCGA